MTASTPFPDFIAPCKDACINLWGNPTRVTAKELRWANGSGSYATDYKKYDLRKNLWYDAAAEQGGKSVIDLALYDQGKKLAKGEKIKGALFFECWRHAYKRGWLNEPPPEKGKPSKPILQTYPYPDEDNTLLFEVVRFDTTDPNERFRQRQPDGKGGYIWSTKGVRMVLYRLPQLIAAVKAGELVLVTEGERDANTAVKLGYAATTMPGGVGKWRGEYDEFFRGADVVIVSDNDSQLKDPKTGKLQCRPDGEPIFVGQDHARKVTKRLTKVAARVRKIMFEVKDLSDWVAAGGTREQLDALIQQAPEYTPPPKELEPTDAKTPADGGLEDRTALEFSAQHAERLRYVAAWNKWLEWDGVRWRFEDTLHAFDLARLLCRGAQDADHRTVAAVVALARTDRRQAATVTQWDADPWLLGTPGGTVDLRTGKLMPARQEDYITKITSVTPASNPPAQSCQPWLEFLQRVTDDNVELQDYLQRVCGYSLTGVTIEDAVFFHYGKGGNGKSVFFDTISGILADYHEPADMEMFVVTHGEKHPTDLASLRGARLVTAIEVEDGRRWAESKLKQMTGGDPLKARFMRQDFFTYIPQFKPMFAGNHKPIFRNVDQAISRRFHLIPWLVTIPPREVVKTLSDDLKAEWPGILRWMIDGCLEWQRVGLKPPKIVTDATQEYLKSQDTPQNFINDCCVLGNNEFDSFEHLWDGWVDYAEDTREFVGTKKAFGQKLKDKGFRSDLHGRNRVMTYFGVRCIRENKKKLMEEARRQRMQGGQATQEE